VGITDGPQAVPGNYAHTKERVIKTQTNTTSPKTNLNKTDKGFMDQPFSLNGILDSIGSGLATGASAVAHFCIADLVPGGKDEKKEAPVPVAKSPGVTQAAADIAKLMNKDVGEVTRIMNDLPQEQLDKLHGRLQAEQTRIINKGSK